MKYLLPVKYLSEPLEAGDISNEGQTADFRVSVNNSAGYNFWYWSSTDPENKIKVNTITDNGDSLFIKIVVL